MFCVLFLTQNSYCSQNYFNFGNIYVIGNRTVKFVELSLN